MTYRTLIAILCLLPATASAQSQLDRFETMSEEMNQMMVGMMANEIESMGGDATALRDITSILPDWDEDMRAAGACVLDQYTDASSSAEVDDMLDRLSAAMPVMQDMGMTEFAESDLADTMLPEGMTIEDSGRITQDCGMLALQMQAMKDTGFTEAMMAAHATVNN